MKIGKYEISLVRNREREAPKSYRCWGCGHDYEVPADFLWHIQYCCAPKELESGTFLS